MPTKFYTINFDGWSPFTFVCEDKSLNEMLQVANKTLEGFMNLYKDSHAFTEAQFMFYPEKGTCGIKIGTLEIEEYERRMNNEKKTDNDTL
jgi:hypothetical protein